VLLVNQRASVGAMSLASKLTSYFTAARPVVGALAAQSETARELERSGAGRLVRPEDPRALADAILWMRAHVGDAARLGGAGAAYAEEWLSRSSVMRSYDAFLEAVAAEIPRTRRIPARVDSERRSAASVEPPAVTLAPAADQITLSCVIVTYESRLALADCLSSLAGERETVELEVIVVDNASRDGTVAMVEADFPWVRVVASSENEGFARATNRALRVAVGRTVLLLNPDTIVPPGALAAVLAELERDPDTGMLGCKLVQPDGVFDHACKRGLPTVSAALYYLIGLQRLFPRSPRFAAYTVGWLDEDSPGYVEAVNGAFMLARREAIEQVGGLDERFWLYGEDLDWCLRFERAGWRIRYWPGVSVTHLKGGSAGGRRSLRAIVAFHRSMLLYYEKHLAPTQHGVVNLLVRIAVWGRCGVVTAHSTAHRAAARHHGRPARSAGRGTEAP
jgi:GT2 family glycosyltransferase